MSHTASDFTVSPLVSRRWRPARILKGVKLPPLAPSAPCGRYSSRDLARAALLSALLRDGDWWGEPPLRRWGADRGLDLEEVRGLLLDLVAQGRVELATGYHPSCPRWRARGA